METPTNPKPSSLCLTNSDEIIKVFNRFDTNHDGKISISELVHVIKSLETTTTEEQVHVMMTNLDTDGDGFISLEEFTGFCTQNAGNDEEGMKELKEAFDHYDLNKNGLISVTELHQILSRLGEKCSLEDCANMIKSVDSDGDGFVNFDEFKTMMSNSSS